MLLEPYKRNVQTLVSLYECLFYFCCGCCVAQLWHNREWFLVFCIASIVLLLVRTQALLWKVIHFSRHICCVCVCDKYKIFKKSLVNLDVTFNGSFSTVFFFSQYVLVNLQKIKHWHRCAWKYFCCVFRLSCSRLAIY